MSAPAGPAGVFDRAAATYDAVGVPFFGPIAEGLVAALAPQPGERVLDVGCGRGAVLGRVARAGRAQRPGGGPGPRARDGAAHRRATSPDLRLGRGARRRRAGAPTCRPARTTWSRRRWCCSSSTDPVAALRRWADLLVAGRRLGVTTSATRTPRWRALDAGLRALPAAARRATRRPRGHRSLRLRRGHGGPARRRRPGRRRARSAATVEVRFRDVEHLLAFTWSHGQRGHVGGRARR